MESCLKITIIEDDLDDVVFFKSILNKTMFKDVEITHFPSFVAAKSLKEKPDIVFLDLSIVDSSGLESVIQIKYMFPGVPVVVITAHGHKDYGAESIKNGAMDYIPKKDLNPTALEKSILFSLERKRVLQELENQASKDYLTNVYNRSYIEKQIQWELSVAKRYNRLFGMIYFDINNFKEINDTFGHHCGDEVLKEFSNRLLKYTRNSDLVARLGGDEFVVLLSEFKDVGDAELIARRKAEKIGNLYNLTNQKGSFQLKVTFSMGCSIYPNDGETITELMQKADAEMYKHKLNLG